MNLSPEKEQGRQVIYVQSETPIVVDHHSYSSVTTPIEKQILTKGLGFKDPMGAGAHRGQAVETGVVQGLLDHNANVESCIKLAEKKYELATMMEPLTAADVQRNRSVIAPMVEALIKELRPYGIPEMGVDGQKKITINLDGVKRPIIGFLDLFYPAHGLIVDIKTTLRMPPKITDSHGLQGAIYSHGVGGNYEVRFVYASDKKCVAYRQDNVREKLEEFRLRTIHREHLLNLYPTWEELAQVITPNYDSFYMSGPEMRQAGKIVWGY